MKKIITLATTIALSAVMTAQTIGNLQFGTDSTFDIMTWNIEHFPKNGQTTINYVSQAITALDLDVIAFQEINDTTLFKQMVNGLPAYAGFARLYEYAGLAFMYKTTTVEINNVYEIFTASNYSNPFPRPPFVLDFNFMNQNFIVIDNHFKCCGDGYINSADAWDEETRRLYASTLLKQYIESHFADKNVIVLGDLNDELTDNQAHNVFQIGRAHV